MKPFRRLAQASAWLKSHAQDEGGATAVEFAMVALPFFFMIFAIIELSLIFMVSVSLENAAGMLARQIRTGEMQTTSGSTADTFKKRLCDNLGWLRDGCETKVTLDVRKFSALAGTNGQGAPITDGAWNTSPPPCFQMGGPADIVLVRVYYEWDLIAPGFTKSLERLKGGKTVIGATTTFRNEPYGSSTTSAACP